MEFISMTNKEQIKDLISVIIPTKETLEPFCMKSVLKQTYPCVEIIVVKDTDKKGACWARNKGREKAQGEYLFFCDDDIELTPEILETFHSKLSKSNASFAYSNYERRGLLTGVVKGMVWNPDRLKENNYISTMSLIKAKDFPIEGFDESLSRFQDWDLWLTMMEKGKYGMFFNRILFVAYYKEGGISCDKSTHDDAMRKVREKHLNKDITIEVEPLIRKLRPENFLNKPVSQNENTFKGKDLSAFEKDEVEIVVVKFNLPEMEQRCIGDVNTNTDFPFKLTVIDNYEKKESLSKVWNDAIKNSTCKYVCLLNNDAFVTKGWLTEMMRGFVDDKVGAVGPSGDHVGGKQRDIGTERQAKQYAGKYVDIDLLSGFCMLLRTDLGIEFPLDVPFYGGEHAWEVLAKRKGYKFVWAQGAFVYHIGEACGKKEGNIDVLRKAGQLAYVTWLAKTTPVLFTTFNRLDYTKKSLISLIDSDTGKIIIVDNNSSDGTRKYLEEMKNKYPDRIELNLEKENKGVSGAMNLFFKLTEGEEYVAKVDNDTIVSKTWLRDMLMMCTHRLIDVMQAKHHILSNTHATFDKWMQFLTPDEKNAHIFYSPFVGGSGVVIKRDKINKPLPDAEWVLGGWGTFQQENKHLKKAFCNNVEIELLDMVGDNEPMYDDYIDYYEKTRRTKVRTLGVERTLEEIIIRLGTRFAYTRFGDGELLMMEDFKGQQYTQYASPELKKEIIESFKIDDKNFLIGNIANMPIERKAEKGLFMPFPNNDDLFRITNKYYKDKTFYNPIAFHYIYVFEEMFYNYILECMSKYKVAFVGGGHLTPIKQRLGISDFVVTPSEQCYSTIEEWYPKVEKVAKRNDIVLLALASVSNVVQKRLWKSGIKVGTIDFGSVANAMVNNNLAGHTWIKKHNILRNN